MLLDYLLIPMICYLIVGMYMNRFLPAVPVWVWVVISVVIIGFINIIGIEPAAKVNSVIIIAQVTFTLLFIAVIIKFVIGGGGTGTLLSWESVFNAKEFSASGLFFASSVLCVSFLGFDAVTTVAEETINPEKTVGKAIMIVAVGAGVVFAIVSYFSQIAWPTAYMSFNDSGTGIFELLDRIKASFMPTLFLVTDNFASLACALAGQAAVARILFGMGRDGALPQKFFGYVHPKYKTPVFNILITSAVALTAIFYSDNLMGAASLVSFGALTGFILVNLSVIFHYFIKERRRSGLGIVKYLLIPIIGVGVCSVLWINLDSSAKILGGIWLLIGLIYTAFTTNFFRKLPPDLKLES
jgi:amino acid transporter